MIETSGFHQSIYQCFPFLMNINLIFWMFFPIQLFVRLHKKNTASLRKPVWNKNQFI